MSGRTGRAPHDQNAAIGQALSAVGVPSMFSGFTKSKALMKIYLASVHVCISSLRLPPESMKILVTNEVLKAVRSSTSRVIRARASIASAIRDSFADTIISTRRVPRRQMIVNCFSTIRLALNLNPNPDSLFAARSFARLFTEFSMAASKNKHKSLSKVLRSPLSDQFFSKTLAHISTAQHFSNFPSTKDAEATLTHGEHSINILTHSLLSLIFENTPPASSTTITTEHDIDALKHQLIERITATIGIAQSRIMLERDEFLHSIVCADGSEKIRETLLKFSYAVIHGAELCGRSLVNRKTPMTHGKELKSLLSLSRRGRNKDVRTIKKFSAAHMNDYLASGSMYVHRSLTLVRLDDHICMLTYQEAQIVADSLMNSCSLNFAIALTERMSLLQHLSLTSNNECGDSVKGVSTHANKLMQGMSSKSESKQLEVWSKLAESSSMGNDNERWKVGGGGKSRFLEALMAETNESFDEVNLAKAARAKHIRESSRKKHGWAAEPANLLDDEKRPHDPVLALELSRWTRTFLPVGQIEHSLYNKVRLSTTVPDHNQATLGMSDADVERCLDKTFYACAFLLLRAIERKMASSYKAQCVAYKKHAEHKFEDDDDDLDRALAGLMTSESKEGGDEFDASSEDEDEGFGDPLLAAGVYKKPCPYVASPTLSEESPLRKRPLPWLTRSDGQPIFPIAATERIESPSATLKSIMDDMVVKKSAIDFAVHYFTEIKDVSAVVFRDGKSHKSPELRAYIDETFAPKRCFEPEGTCDKFVNPEGEECGASAASKDEVKNMGASPRTYDADRAPSVSATIEPPGLRATFSVDQTTKFALPRNCNARGFLVLALLEGTTPQSSGRKRMRNNSQNAEESCDATQLTPEFDPDVASWSVGHRRVKFNTLYARLAKMLHIDGKCFQERYTELIAVVGPSNRERVLSFSDSGIQGMYLAFDSWFGMSAAVLASAELAAEDDSSFIAPLRRADTYIDDGRFVPNLDPLVNTDIIEEERRFYRKFEFYVVSLIDPNKTTVGQNNGVFLGEARVGNLMVPSVFREASSISVDYSSVADPGFTSLFALLTTSIQFLNAGATEAFAAAWHVGMMFVVCTTPIMLGYVASKDIGADTFLRSLYALFTPQWAGGVGLTDCLTSIGRTATDKSCLHSVFHIVKTPNTPFNSHFRKLCQNIHHSLITHSTKHLIDAGLYDILEQYEHDFSSPEFFIESTDIMWAILNRNKKNTSISLACSLISNMLGEVDPKSTNLPYLLSAIEETCDAGALPFGMREELTMNPETVLDASNNLHTMDMSIVHSVLSSMTKPLNACASKLLSWRALRRLRCVQDLWKRRRRMVKHVTMKLYGSVPHSLHTPVTRLPDRRNRTCLDFVKSAYTTEEAHFSVLIDLEACRVALGMRAGLVLVNTIKPCISSLVAKPDDVSSSCNVAILAHDGEAIGPRGSLRLQRPLCITPNRDGTVSFNGENVPETYITVITTEANRVGSYPFAWVSNQGLALPTDTESSNDFVPMERVPQCVKHAMDSLNRLTMMRKCFPVTARGYSNLTNIHISSAMQKLIGTNQKVIHSKALPGLNFEPPTASQALMRTSNSVEPRITGALRSSGFSHAVPVVNSYTELRRIFASKLMTYACSYASVLCIPLGLLVLRSEHGPMGSVEVPVLKSLSHSQSAQALSQVNWLAESQDHVLMTKHNPNPKRIDMNIAHALAHEMTKQAGGDIFTSIEALKWDGHSSVLSEFESSDDGTPEAHVLEINFIILIAHVIYSSSRLASLWHKMTTGNDSPTDFFITLSSLRDGDLSLQYYPLISKIRSEFLQSLASSRRFRYRCTNQTFQISEASLIAHTAIIDPVVHGEEESIIMLHVPYKYVMTIALEQLPTNITHLLQLLATATECCVLRARSSLQYEELSFCDFNSIREAYKMARDNLGSQLDPMQSRMPHASVLERAATLALRFISSHAGRLVVVLTYPGLHVPDKFTVRASALYSKQIARIISDSNTSLRSLTAHITPSALPNTQPSRLISLIDSLSRFLD